jgi:TetR/AcrR family transcriptional regulator, fatty acid biosynthesis regulator
MHGATRTRTRLDPQLRQSQILDVAAALVTEEGVAAVNMNRVALAAGVSKALVYAYFPNQTAMLQALLLRETDRLNALHWTATQAALDFPDFVRRTTRIALAHIEESGIFMQRLLSEPSVALAVEAHSAATRQAQIAYLSQRIHAEFGIPEHMGEKVVDICLGLTGAAGAHMRKTGAPIDEIEDLTVTMILGSLKAIAARHGASVQAASPAGSSTSLPSR